jgi:hypothetical protein
MGKLIRVATVLALGSGCTLDRQLHHGDEVAQVKPKESPYLKAHYKNGNVAILANWSFDPAKNEVAGSGELRDMHRQPLSSGPMHIAVGEVALFESNREVANGGVIAAMTLVTVASAAVSIACLTNPKACFGSCPTFYVGDGDRDYLAAEGFSESVAPSLEATDVDALWRAKITGRTARLRVTNEALETHAIRQANLLVARKPANGRVLATPDGHYREAFHFQAPITCAAQEGDCLSAVRASDPLERISVTDGKDLATKETVELTFDPGPTNEPQGVMLEVRQGFITTYLFYQALAYMGRNAGTYLAAMEQGNGEVRDKARALYHLLGGIDVQTRDERGQWKTVGTYLETGPLAREVQLVPLPVGETARTVRLVMARGHFRLGQVALVSLGRTVSPERIAPSAIATTHGDAALAQQWIAHQTPFLTTLPGDEHALTYVLPTEGDDLEFFLEARGYYLEWMRQAWLAEESDWKLGKLFTWPASAMKEMAPAYQRVESTIEKLFWESRYVR